MAISTEVIRKITIQGSTQGVTQATDELNKFAAAQGNVAVVSDTTSKRALSAEAAYNRQTLSVVAGARAHADLEKALRVAQAALNQGVISAQEHANRVGLLNEKYGQVSAGSKAFAAATSGVSGQLIALSAGAGPVGVFLSALGPWGIAAAAGIGLLGLAFEEAKRTAHLLAAEAIELQRFAETTGLSTNTLQALTQAAALHGVAAETTIKSIEKFTVSWAEARDGAGKFLIDLRKVDPVLADQIQRTKDSATALEIFTQAVKKADAAGDIAARNQLLRAAGGRGGIPAFAGVSAAIGDAGSLANLTQHAIDAGKAIGGDLLKEVQHLQVEIDEAKKHADLLFGTIGAEPILKAELAWQKLRGEMALSAIALADAEKSKPFWSWYFEKIAEAHQASMSLLPLPPLPTVNLPLPAYPPQLNMAGLIGPAPTAPADPAKTLAAQLTDLKEKISLLGSAATADDKLAERELTLAAAVKANSTAEIIAAAARGLSAAQLDAYIEKINLHNAALGVAATVQDIVTARLVALQKQQLQGANLTDAQVANAKRLAQAQADGTFQLQTQIDAMKVQTATIGMSVGAAEEFSLIQTKINENLNAGRPKYDGITDAYRRMAAEAGNAKQVEAQKAAQDKANFDQQIVFLSAVDQQIAQVQKHLHGNDWQAFMNDGLAATMRLTDGLKQLKDATQQFATTLASGLYDGKSLTDSLKASFDQLGKAALNAGVKNLLEGNFVMAGVDAAVAIGSKLAGNFFDDSQQKALEKAKIAFAGMSSQVLNFNAAAEGFSLSQFVSAIQQIESTALSLIKAAMAAGDTASAIQLIFTAVKSVNSQVDQFIKPKGNSAGEQIASTQNEAQQIIGELNSLNQQYNLGLNRTTDILAAAAAKVADIQANVTKTLQADINTATGKSWINDLQTLVDETKTLQAQSAATNTDPTLIGRRFEVMAQKIVDGAQLTGDAFGELQTLFPDLTGKVHAYTAAVQDNADALKKAADATAKSIVDYLNGLTSGPGSTLAPTTVLSNAQSSYNANYALALGGSIDAQNKFVSLADNLEKAARAVYASGQGYQDIRNQIINQGLALPAVQATTDPVVASLRDNLAAIQAQTLAIQDGNATQALDATLQNVIKSAIDAGNATAIAALLVPKFDQLDTTADGALNFSEFVAGLGPSYANVFTKAQLDAAGLSKDVTLGGLLTPAGLAAAGLSKEQGNIASVFSALAQGDGLLSKTDAIRAATQGVQTAAQGTQDNTSTTASRLNINGASDGVGHETQWHSQQNGILISIQQTLRDAFVAGPLNNLAGTFNIPSSSSDPVITALRKIVYNTGVIAINTYTSSLAQGGLRAYGTFATGGVIPPHGLGLVSEHLNPTWVRAGAEPITVSPFTPSAGNDNSALIAEVKRLNDKIDRLERVIAGSGANIARAVVESGEHVADTVETQTDTLAAQERQSNRQRKVA